MKNAKAMSEENEDCSTKKRDEDHSSDPNDESAEEIGPAGEVLTGPTPDEKLFLEFMRWGSATQDNGDESRLPNDETEDMDPPLQADKYVGENYQLQ